MRKSVLATLAAQPERVAVGASKALESIPGAFGRPHLHQGLGIRQLRPGIYEARLGLDLRAIFTRERDWLRVQFVGSHDAVKRWLRNLT